MRLLFFFSLVSSISTVLISLSSAYDDPPSRVEVTEGGPLSLAKELNEVLDTIDPLFSIQEEIRYYNILDQIEQASDQIMVSWVLMNGLRADYLLASDQSDDYLPDHLYRRKLVGPINSSGEDVQIFQRMKAAKADATEKAKTLLRPDDANFLQIVVPPWLEKTDQIREIGTRIAQYSPNDQRRDRMIDELESTLIRTKEEYDKRPDVPSIYRLVAQVAAEGIEHFGGSDDSDILEPARTLLTAPPQDMAADRHRCLFDLELGVIRNNPSYQKEVWPENPTLTLFEKLRLENKIDRIALENAFRSIPDRRSIRALLVNFVTNNREDSSSIARITALGNFFGSSYIPEDEKNKIAATIVSRLNQETHHWEYLFASAESDSHVRSTLLLLEVPFISPGVFFRIIYSFEEKLPDTVRFLHPETKAFAVERFTAFKETKTGGNTLTALNDILSILEEDL